MSLLALGAAFACGGGAKVSDGDCVGPSCTQKDPCQTVYAGKCGKPCDTTDDCDAGLHCSAEGECTAVCVRSTSANPCGEGKECTSDGRCRDLLLGMGGSDGSGGGGGSCIDVNVNFEPQVPTVVLLVDQSGSMNAGDGWSVPDDYEPWGCPNNGTWRWNVVRNVLFNPDTGVVKPLEDKVRFGLTLYSSDDFEEACPMLDKVPIALSNYEAMFSRFECSDLVEDTPTEPSLRDAVADLEEVDEPGPKIVILATDGEPDTCECPDFSGTHVPASCRGDNAAAKQQEAKDGVVSAAAAALAKDVTVHVINVSSPGNASLQTHLEDVAEAGGGNVYPGFSPNELKAAFEEIIAGARSCKLDLGGEIASGREGDGDVRLNGEKLRLNDPDGWKVNSPTQIELVGEACEAIKVGDPSLTIKFPCGGFVVR
jgi:hypothetical protein